MPSFLRRLVWAVAACVCALGAPVHAQALKWAPPHLVNPVVINIGQGSFHAQVSTSQDCIVKWPATKHVGYVWIEGCHNVVSMGGYGSVPQPADHSNNPPSRILYFSQTTGVIHIEGLLGDASAGGMSDGLDFEAPLATVQIENVRIDGIFGYANLFHADCIQPFGGVKALRIYNFTCRTAYQGLSIGAVWDSPAGWTADIERTNIQSIGPEVWGPDNTGGYIYWPCSNAACSNAALTSLNQVYLQPRPGNTFRSTVWATSIQQNTPAGAAPTLTFPGLPIIGAITLGPPPSGDFVPVGVAGLNYRSPGYAS